MIDFMVQRLYIAQQKIQEIQKKYYWLPIPSKTGPEDGVSVRPLIISKEIFNSVLLTKTDYEMGVLAVAKFVDESVSTKTYKSATSENVYAFSGSEFVTPAFDAQNTNNEDSLKVISFDEINKKRTVEMEKAGKALQDIEVIMGEFSGFGLCDVLAVIASLYTISKKSLLGFLDDDAFDRMKEVLSVENEERATLQESLEEMTNTVKDFYNLMDKIYSDRTGVNRS
jgi:hypothetical protein